MNVDAARASPWEVRMRWGDRSLEAEVVDAHRKTLRFGDRDDDDLVLAHGARLELAWNDGALSVRFSTGVSGEGTLDGQASRSLGALIETGRIKEEAGTWVLTLRGDDSLSLQVGGPRILIRRAKARVVRVAVDPLAMAALVGALVLLLLWLFATFQGMTPLNLMPKEP